MSKAKKDPQDANDVTGAPKKPNMAGFSREIRWFACLILLMLGFQSVIAKPFYIPSVSMMPTLLTGDRIIATKYPYGWSWVSMVPRLLPHSKGRVMGNLPKRGDIVTVTPPGRSSDYIKRVIGLPGDTVSMKRGALFINGIPVKRERIDTTDILADPNTTCTEGDQIRFRFRDKDGVTHCLLPIYRETLPNGRSYETIDLGYLPAVDDFDPVKVPADHLFLMGDNRDQSADSRVALRQGGLGGPVPFENVSGRAELVTFSMSGNWWPMFRSGRAGTGLRP